MGKGVDRPQSGQRTPTGAWTTQRGQIGSPQRPQLILVSTPEWRLQNVVCDMLLHSQPGRRSVHSTLLGTSRSQISLYTSTLPSAYPGGGGSQLAVSLLDMISSPVHTVVRTVSSGWPNAYPGRGQCQERDERPQPGVTGQDSTQYKHGYAQDEYLAPHQQPQRSPDRCRHPSASGQSEEGRPVVSGDCGECRPPPDPQIQAEQSA